MSSVTLVSLVAGLLLLLAGKKTFWLFLGLAGIAVAIAFVPRIFPDLDQQSLLLVSIAAGIIGGILAFALSRALVWVGGFVAGGYLGVIAWQTVVHAPAFPWVAAVVGGIVGMLVAKFLFDSALVLASSAVGAALLVHVSGLEGTTGLAALVVLTAAGIIVQGRLWPRSSSGRPAVEKDEQ
jgi:FAD/FMN-containing dehydrogenase